MAHKIQRNENDNRQSRCASVNHNERRQPRETTTTKRYIKHGGRQKQRRREISTTVEDSNHDEEIYQGRCHCKQPAKTNDRQSNEEIERIIHVDYEILRWARLIYHHNLQKIQMFTETDYSMR